MSEIYASGWDPVLSMNFELVDDDPENSTRRLRDRNGVFDGIAASCDVIERKCRSAIMSRSPGPQLDQIYQEHHRP